jgi:hypothetical protein
MRLCQRFPSRPQRPSARAAGAALACAGYLIAAASSAAWPGTAGAADRGQHRQPIAAGSSPSLTGLRDQVGALQRSLNADRSRLSGLMEEVKLAQSRLAQLEGDEAQAERALALHLIMAYESGVANVRGARSSELIGGVRAAHVAVVTEAIQLGSLSRERPQATEQVLEERGRLTGAKSALAASQRAGASSALVQDVGDEPPGGAPAPTLGTAAGPGTPGAGSSLDFPIPAGDVAPPATWALVGGGVDIAAPGDTPELAVCTGTVVLHGIGGLGPWTPVLHCDSPIAGHDYVYYGDAGPGDWTPVGTPVSAGQTISEVGPGIIGDSTGPDLEIGFADDSGAPLGSAGAPDIMKLLRTAYRS